MAMLDCSGVSGYLLDAYKLPSSWIHPRILFSQPLLELLVGGDDLV